MIRNFPKKIFLDFEKLARGKKRDLCFSLICGKSVGDAGTLWSPFLLLMNVQGVRLRVCKTSLDLNPSILVRFQHNMAHFKGKAWHFEYLLKNSRQTIEKQLKTIVNEFSSFSSKRSIEVSQNESNFLFLTFAQILRKKSSKIS